MILGFMKIVVRSNLSNVSLQVLTMFEENYPEGLKRLFVIKGKCSLCLKKSQCDIATHVAMSHLRTGSL